MSGEMTPREFQNYLALLGRLLRLGKGQREAIAEELRSHLEERLAALAEQGVAPDEAVSTALAEFGDAAALAAEFSAVFSAKKRRWIMRMTISSVAAAILAVGAIISLWPDGHGNLAPPAAIAQKAEEETRAEEAPKAPDPSEETWCKLQQPGQADFIDVPLGEVLDFLADVSQVQFYVDRNALEDVGLDPASTIDLSLKDVPIEMILRLALRQLYLTYTLDHGVVIVTTPETAEISMIIRVYPVADLLRAEVSDPTISPDTIKGSMDPIAPLSESQSGAGASDRDPVAGSDTSSSSCQMFTETPARPTSVSSFGLVNLITKVVEPNTWEDVGGPGSICVFDQSLVIAQTWQVHRKIETLLADLRQAAASQSK